MSRRRKDLQDMDIGLWPTVDTNALSTQILVAFNVDESKSRPWRYGGLEQHEVPVSSPIDVRRPIEIKRLPWMLRIHVHIPKLALTLVLFSGQRVNTFALIKSCPQITDFCEQPGFIDVDGQRALAEFWVKSDERQVFLKLANAVELLPELPKQVPAFTGVAISRVPSDWFETYRHWIANWLQINPYLVSNTRFVTSEMLERVAGIFKAARPLYDAEHALRDMDKQLVRTATFMLLR